MIHTREGRVRHTCRLGDWGKVQGRETMTHMKELRGGKPAAGGWGRKHGRLEDAGEGHYYPHGGTEKPAAEVKEETLYWHTAG